MAFTGVFEADIAALYKVLSAEASAGGYFLNPDEDFTRNLLSGLLKNEQRYGYRACPCRLASGKREEDRDIICPCDYRDPDLDEYGSCYCALYVSAGISSGEESAAPVPDRRPSRSMRAKSPAPLPSGDACPSRLAFPVWRCRVCGYLCARNQPPGLCPVCKATNDRFERFL